ncbi:MAG: zinc-ribbon domain-containing protein [Phascolarctobacterium sp.]|nr:zinc-ribbon domain-containing protein [Phascolarctobacterium sp.]
MAKAVQNRTCPACGTTLADNAKFCNECGTKYVAPVEDTEPEHKTKQTMLLRKMVYTIDEAAQSLGVSTSFLNKLIAKGGIVVCRQGKRVGVTEWSLYNYARSCEVDNGEELKIV